MDPIRLSEHVTVLTGSGGGAYPRGNPLVVRGGQSLVQIDSSLDAPARDVDLVLASHAHEDHLVALGETTAPVTVHRRDVEAVLSWDEFRRVTHLGDEAAAEALRREYRLTPRPEASAFDDDEVIEVGGGVRIRVVPLPGHTAGHCGFLIEPDGVFFLADVDLSSFGPVYCDAGSTLAEVKTSLARCAEIDAAVYATFHHKGPYTDRAQYLADLATHTAALDRRQQRIGELLAELGPHAAPADLVGRGVVFADGGRRPWYADVMEEHMIAAHLADKRSPQPPRC